MSRGSQEKHEEVLGELTRELRQFTGLAASFFRAAATRIGMTVTDMQVMDLLTHSGPSTAGQLADLTGLTTGAITGMLNRLEEAGLVRRERDPNDGRRVIVQLARGKDERQEIGPIFANIEKAWDEMASDYDDEQIAFLLEFLKRSNAISRKEVVRLREAPEGEGGIYTAALGELKSGRLVVSSGISRMTLRAGKGMTELYQASFEGPAPDVKAKEGVVTIRYPRRLWALVGEQRAAEVTLNAAIPWQVVIQGGAAEITAELGGLNLAGMEVKGGLSSIRLELPAPEGAVPIRISGGASEITIRRPAGVAARVHLKGWASHFIFDDQTFSDLGNDVRLQSPGFDLIAPYYDIEVASSVSAVTITAG
ncbi:MAG TPA: MarR family winged helix-turn-helix transcriptional regulator [Ktedonosporobacter sp.]|nr:MarR family winged helix-turn-helix transcriptional regulator [Ktedonosporobacter sp.]